MAGPPRLARARVECSLSRAAYVASHFLLPRPLDVYDFPDKGNINQHTFLVLAGSGETRGEYLLQRINHDVFTRPRSVMAAMRASIQAQREYLSRCPLPAGREWEVITLVPTWDGSDVLEPADGDGITFWRLMVKIPDARTYKSLNKIPPARRLEAAAEAGCGLAMYSDFTASMDVSGLENPLPGYRDTRVYYDQFFSVLAGHRTLESAEPYLPADPVVRQSTERHFLVHLPAEEYRRRMEDPTVRRFISLAEESCPLGMKLLHAMESGAIRTVAIHGDTKLDNFLFSTRTGQVKALVDLDTIMPHTWLADWGDMVRSLVNVAGEKEANLQCVQADEQVFAALARGFLGTARQVTPAEVDLMVDAVQIIALELGLRFLTDYLRGDTYFRVGPNDPPDLNRIRGLCQLTLFERLRAREDALRACIESVRRA